MTGSCNWLSMFLFYAIDLVITKVAKLLIFSHQAVIYIPVFPTIISDEGCK